MRIEKGWERKSEVQSALSVTITPQLVLIEKLIATQCNKMKRWRYENDALKLERGTRTKLTSDGGSSKRQKAERALGDTHSQGSNQWREKASKLGGKL